MPTTTTDLYRRGNAAGPRLTNVRIGKDVVTYQNGGTNWVKARSGGVSTFSAQGPGQNWWLLPEGFDYPDDLFVVNDHGNHYNWEPRVDLPLADFIRLLASVQTAFRKVSWFGSLMMNLSLKATRFVIEALEHYEKYHDERLQQEGLREDDASDLGNDRQYLEAIKKGFQEYLDSLIRKREGVQTER